MSKTLYERLGGFYSIAAVVDDFLSKVLADPVINANPKVDAARKSGHVTPAGFKYIVTEMVCAYTGGPQKYSARGMKESHKHLDITGNAILLVILVRRRVG